jgi:predicted XRE-type DNA-binding protein
MPKAAAKRPSKPKLFVDVFEDLGYTKPEAARLRLQAELAHLVDRYIEKKRLTEAQAAERLGVSRGRIADLQRGKFDAFSIDDLVEMLARIGVAVSLKARKST